MKGQHGPDRAMTRYRHDVSKMIENTEISTGPGRWALGVPNSYGNAAFVPDVTTINQRWGASHIMTSTKTDVESDLKNLGRPSVRTTCGQYQPEEGAELAAGLVAMPEVAFPQTASHLVDPPCTLRGTGINRWQWLCEDPQENVMVPFEHLVDTRHSSKDAVYHALLNKPLEQSQIARDRQFMCGKVFMEPAVPVARPRRPDEPANFNDTIPGSSQRMGTPVARETPTGLPTAGRNSYAVPITYTNNGERERAAKGILAPPPNFVRT